MTWKIRKLSVGPENTLTGQVKYVVTAQEDGTGEVKTMESAYNPAVGLTVTIVKDAMCAAALDPNELGSCT